MIALTLPAAALRFLKKLLRRHGRPEVLVTDRLRTYGAALLQLDLQEKQQSDGRWIRAENSDLSLRRRERAMLRFRRMRSQQKFAAVRSSVYNHFNLEGSLSSRSIFRTNRTAALEEWRGLYAG